MYRLLLLAIALPFVGDADLGRAASKQSDVEIVAVDLAGRQTNLTQNPANDAAPSPSRDGRIVFVSARDGRPDLYVMDGDGRSLHRLTTSPFGGGGVAWGPPEEGATQASWSPRSKRITFDAEFAQGGRDCTHLCVNWKVHIVDADGSGLREVSPLAKAPAWSPDGRRLAYESDLDADAVAGSVTIKRLDGSGSVRLNAVILKDGSGPVWSPTGKELAFESLRGGVTPNWISIVGADGRRKRRLAVGHNPFWSPNGRRIAFINNYRLITLGENGKGRRRLSRNGELVLGAAWSPKGNSLAVVTASALAQVDPGVPTGLRLETVSSDGKRVRVLVHEPAGSNIWSGPVWTPDGKRILVAVG
jgi:Tol biopolymer transport system component